MTKKVGSTGLPVKTVVLILAVLAVAAFVMFRIAGTKALPSGESAGVARPLEHPLPFGMPYRPGANAPKSPQPQKPPVSTDRWGN